MMVRLSALVPPPKPGVYSLMFKDDIVSGKDWWYFGQTGDLAGRLSWHRSRSPSKRPARALCAAYAADPDPLAAFYVLDPDEDRKDFERAMIRSAQETGLNLLNQKCLTPPEQLRRR